MIVWVIVAVLAVIVGYKWFMSSESNKEELPVILPKGISEGKTTAEPKREKAAPLTPTLPTRTPAVATGGPRRPINIYNTEAAGLPAAIGMPSRFGSQMITAFLTDSLGKINAEAGEPSPRSFQQRVAQYQAQVSRAATLVAYMGIDEISAPDFQLVSNEYAFTVVGSLLLDAHGLEQQVKEAVQVTDLEAIRTDINDVLLLVHNLHDALKPNENAVKASGILTDVLEGADHKAGDKIKEIYTSSLGEKSSPASEQLFNLGFYLLNSRDLFAIPHQPVTDGPFEFKTAFFPKFDVIKWEDYQVAKSLFDLALLSDRTNVLAEIYGEVACLNAAMSNEYAEYSREEIIDHLRAIVAKHPEHALAHIELAHAYASVSEGKLAAQHTERALAIGQNSSYLRFSAMQVYRNLSEKDKEAALLSSLELDAYESNNPRLFYLKALRLTEPTTLLLAFSAIQRAINHGKSKNYFWLRTELLSYLKKKLSDNEYASLRGDELTREGNSEVKLLEQRERKFKMEHVGFRPFVSLAFSPDYASVEVVAQQGEPPIQHLLAENKASVIVLDFNSTMAELALLGVFACSSVLTSGQYYVGSEANGDSGTFYLKGLNIESLFETKQ